MSKYTTELRYIVEQGVSLGLDKYPIFDESYRAGLNDKIINHFYFREIGFETAGLFINRLNVRMNEIMPYFNQLYESELLKFDPITNFDYNESVKDDETKTRREDVDQSHSNTVTGSATTETQNAGEEETRMQTALQDQEKNGGYSYDSVTPEQIFTPDDLATGIYASEAHVDKTTHDLTRSNLDQGKNTSRATGSGTTDSTTTDRGNADSSLTGNETRLENIIRHLTGRNAISGSSLLTEFRATLLNIDMQVIDALADLFMGIY